MGEGLNREGNRREIRLYRPGEKTAEDDDEDENDSEMELTKHISGF
jgi:hypothetical protein